MIINKNVVIIMIINKNVVIIMIINNDPRGLLLSLHQNTKHPTKLYEGITQDCLLLYHNVIA